MNVHSYCQKKVANLCGINQKLLAEALTQVSQVSFFMPFCVCLRAFESIYSGLKCVSFMAVCVRICSVSTNTFPP